MSLFFSSCLFSFMPTLQERANRALRRSGDAICPNCRNAFRIRSGGYSKHLRSCNERKLWKDTVKNRRDRVKSLQKNFLTYLTIFFYLVLISFLFRQRPHRDEELMQYDAPQAHEIQDDASHAHEIQDDASHAHEIQDDASHAHGIQDDAQAHGMEVSGDTAELPPAQALPLSEIHIRIVHHPASGLPDERITIPEYQERMCETSTASHQNPSDTLWEPFQSEADFTFADFVCQNRLSQAQIDRLIKLSKATWSDSSKVTFRNHQDVRKALDHAKDKTTLVCYIVYMTTI